MSLQSIGNPLARRSLTVLVVVGLPVILPVVSVAHGIVRAAIYFADSVTTLPQSIRSAWRGR